MSADSKDHANVIMIPPLLFVPSLVLGWLLHQWRPIRILPELTVTTIAGWGLVIISIGLVIWAVREFRIATEPVNVYQPTNTIVPSGPYEFSRNPMYLAMAILYLGITVLVNSLWLLILLLPALWLVHYGVIIREEHYLQEKLGDEYARYKAKVRRWL